MVKKCMYCSSGIEDESVIDFCRKCGIGVWGQKMFETIKKNMEEANMAMYPIKKVMAIGSALIILSRLATSTAKIIVVLIFVNTITTFK